MSDEPVVAAARAHDLRVKVWEIHAPKVVVGIIWPNMHGWAFWSGEVVAATMEPIKNTDTGIAEARDVASKRMWDAIDDAVNAAVEVAQDEAEVSCPAP